MGRRWQARGPEPGRAGSLLRRWTYENGRGRGTVLRWLMLVALGAVAVVPAAGQARTSAMQITSCGQTVTTDAVLAQDLVCAGDGIVVGASEITIGLKGFVLRGDGGAGDFGIDNSAGFDEVTILNGVLRNFENGVAGFNDADSMTISNVVASGNTAAGFTVDGDGAFIEFATAAGNGSHGIEVDGDRAFVEDSHAEGNGSQGIDITGEQAQITSSTAAGNAGGGISVAGGEAFVTTSTAAGNGSDGISVQGEKAKLKTSTGSGNGEDGIAVVGGLASIQSSTATGNDSYGMSVDGNKAKVKTSTAAGNSGGGIHVDGDAPAVAGNRADGNGFDGGVSDNSGLGILAEGFATSPIGTNKARGNDDPAECAPASLC